MLDEITKAVESLSADNLDRFIGIIVNNPSLGALNHAYLFNQGHIEHTVMPESSIDEQKRKVTGNEAMIYIPVYKESLSYGRVRVKEVRTRKKTMVSTNLMLRFFKAFNRMPKESNNVPDGRLGIYSKEDSEAYISPLIGRNVASSKELVNKAIFEILVDLYLANAGIENGVFREFLMHIVLLSEGFDRKMPDIDVDDLKNFLDVKNMILLSNIAKKCHYLNEAVTVDMEEVMLLRIFLNKQKEETLRILESLSPNGNDEVLALQLEELRKKLCSTNEESYSNLFSLKEEKKLLIHLKLQGYFDSREYFKL